MWLARDVTGAMTSQADACSYCMGSVVSIPSLIYLYSSYFVVPDYCATVSAANLCTYSNEHSMYIRFLWDSPTNIRESIKTFQGQSLDYFPWWSVTKKKSFITLIPGRRQWWRKPEKTGQLIKKFGRVLFKMSLLPTFLKTWQLTQTFGHFRPLLITKHWVHL